MRALSEIASLNSSYCLHFTYLWLHLDREGKMWTIEEATGKLLLSPIGTSKKAEKTSKRISADEASISSDVEKPAAEKGSSDEGHPEFKTPQSPSGHPVSVIFDLFHAALTLVLYIL